MEIAPYSLAGTGRGSPADSIDSPDRKIAFGPDCCQCHIREQPKSIYPQERGKDGARYYTPVSDHPRGWVLGFDCPYGFGAKSDFVSSIRRRLPQRSKQARSANRFKQMRNTHEIRS